MADIKFTNFAHSLLAVGIGTGDTTISVTGGHGVRFPALTAPQYFYLTLEDAALNREIVKVTARATDSMTVVRAQDGTTARSWSAGSTSVALRLNAAAIEDVLGGAGGVQLTGNQTVGGTKTFTSPIVGSLNGNADTVTDGVYASTDQTLSGAKRGAITTDNDLSFDMNAGNNFACTPTGAGTLTFTNLAAGQSGFIKLVNGANYTISAAATTKINAADLTTISATGTYVLSYFCDGTNAFVVTSRAVA